MKFFLTLLTLLIMNFVFAQFDPIADFNRHVASNWKGEFIRIGSYKVKGTPHLFGESLPGTITYKGDKKVADNKIFYDIYQQKIGSDINGNFTEMNVEVVEFFVITPEGYGGKKLNFKPASAFGNNKLKGFVEVLADGSKVSFLKYFKASVAPDPVNQMDKEARIFEQGYDYYIFNKTTNTLSKVKLKEKDILKVLASDKEKNNFITANIDFSKEAEVISIIDQYNKVR